MVAERPTGVGCAAAVTRFVGSTSSRVAAAVSSLCTGVGVSAPGMCERFYPSYGYATSVASDAVFR
jgi:hypothetical protein